VEKKREYLKDKIDELATNSKNKNIRDLYRGKLPHKYYNFSSRTEHSQISHDMLWKILAQHLLDDGLGGVVQFCGHPGSPDLTSPDFFF
jgi:hypothetical protein